MEANFFHEHGEVGPELGRRTTTTELKKYYTKRTRMRMAEEKDKDGNRQQHQYTAPQEMRQEASNLLPKAATANGNNLLFPCTNKNDSCPFDYNYGGGLEQIKMGCLYELNHSLTGQNSLPVQLKSVRAVMVIARTEVNVILRFPSAASLHAHFNNTNVVVSDDQNKRIQYQHPQLMKKGKLCVHPELDEEYMMNLKLAGKLLIRQILSSEFSKQKHLKSFWTPIFQQPIFASTPVQDHSGSDDYYISDDDGNCSEARVAPMGWNGGPENYQSNLYSSSPVAVGSSGGGSGNDSNLIMRKRGNCWSALTNISDLHWGVRRRVAFMGPNRNNCNNDHHQEYYNAEISNKRIMLKSSNNNYTTTNRASEHRYHQHQSSLGIFGAVPEEEEQEQEQDEEEANATEVGEITGMDQDQNNFKTNTITEDNDDDEYHLSLERRRRSLRSRRNLDRNSKQLVVMLRNRKNSNNSKTAKKKIKPQCSRGLDNQKEEEEDSDDEQNKPTRRATRSSATAAGLKIKIKKNNTIKKKKRIKNAEQSIENSNQIVIHNKKQLVSVTSYDRWSKERYRKAEVSMLQIMKEKDAVAGKPVIRRVLRMEARKYIGDTGLLDHLLKHMSGKVAPDGELRFRRRHNPEGEMEYWLENADLVNIRREAGVKDPYWTAPPGWMPGDNPSQDPLCAKDIKFLKQEMSTLKRNVEEIMYTHKQQKKKNGDSSELVLVPVNNLSSSDTPLVEADDCTQDQSGVPELQVSISPITTITTPLVVDQQYHRPQSQLQNSHPLEEDYNNLMKRKAQLEQQLLEISNSLNGLQEEVLKFTSRVEDAVSPTTIAGAEKSSSVLTVVENSNTRKRKAGDEKPLDDQVWLTPERSDDHEKVDQEKQKVDGKETKEEKRQRLRSGFRICKPQGSFLWPNMVVAASSPGNNTSNSSSTCSNRMMMLSPTATYNQSHVVPTPTSVTSSTTSKSDFLLLPPPQNQEAHLTTPPPVKTVTEESSAFKKIMVTTIPSTSFSPSNNDKVEHFRVTNLNLGSPPDVPAYHNHQSSSSHLWRDQTTMYHHRQVGLHDNSPATNNQGLFCGTPTNSFYTNRPNTSRAGPAVRQHHQQQPRTLVLLPNVSCGRGNDDKNLQRQEKDVVRIAQEAAAAVSFNSRNATGTTSDYDMTTRREMMNQQYYQRKQKQHHQQQQ